MNTLGPDHRLRPAAGFDHRRSSTTAPRGTRADSRRDPRWLHEGVERGPRGAQAGARRAPATPTTTLQKQAISHYCRLMSRNLVVRNSVFRGFARRPPTAPSVFPDQNKYNICTMGHPSPVPNRLVMAMVMVMMLMAMVVRW